MKTEKPETFTVLTSFKTAPHNRCQPHPAEPEHYTKCSNGFFVLLKMGIMMPEVETEVNNKHLTVASCWFFYLHTLLTMHGHRYLKLPVNFLFSSALVLQRAHVHCPFKTAITRIVLYTKSDIFFILENTKDMIQIFKLNSSEHLQNAIFQYHRDEAYYGQRQSSGLQSLTPNHGGPASVPYQYMWNLWCTKWHWDTFLSEYFRFPCQYH